MKEPGRLKPKEIADLNADGDYPDGGGLYLQVRNGGRAKSWKFRYSVRVGATLVDGKLAGGKYKDRQRGCGPWPDVDEQQARVKAREYRQMRRDGIDPIEKHRAAVAVLSARIQDKTVGEMVPPFFVRYQVKWGPGYYKAAIRNFNNYVLPKWRDVLARSVTIHMVSDLLLPIQQRRAEVGEGGPPTANALRKALKAFFDYCAAQNQFSGANPAANSGALPQLLPTFTEVHEEENFPALPISKVGAFLAELRGYKDMRGGDRSGSGSTSDDSRRSRPISALILEFMVLLPARPKEICGMRWDEIDFDRHIWTCPKSRTKNAKRKNAGDHVMPLSDQCMAVLEAMKAENTESLYVFIDRRADKPIAPCIPSRFLRRSINKDGKWVDKDGKGITMHGFRATFQSWAVERFVPANAHGLSAFDLSEIILGHIIHQNTQGSVYARLADHSNPLRHMVDQYAKFCDQVVKTGEVTKPSELENLRQQKGA